MDPRVSDEACHEDPPAGVTVFSQVTSSQRADKGGGDTALDYRERNLLEDLQGTLSRDSCPRPLSCWEESRNVAAIKCLGKGVVSEQSHCFRLAALNLHALCDA